MLIFIFLKKNKCAIIVICNKSIRDSFHKNLNDVY